MAYTHTHNKLGERRQHKPIVYHWGGCAIGIRNPQSAWTKPELHRETNRKTQREDKEEKREQEQRTQKNERRGRERRDQEEGEKHVLSKFFSKVNGYSYS